MFACRAGELRGLYRGLQLQGLTAGERLDVLLHVKFRAKEFDCSLTRELVQLIDREADLINRYASVRMKILYAVHVKTDGTSPC
jgi:hypothetical protein